MKFPKSDSALSAYLIISFCRFSSALIIYRPPFSSLILINDPALHEVPDILPEKIIIPKEEIIVEEEDEQKFSDYEDFDNLDSFIDDGYDESGDD